jgi:predicted dehydrogenase
MAERLTRREMVRKTVLGGLGFWVARGGVLAQGNSANDKLNLAIVGVAGRGRANTDQVMEESIVALCDVDDNYLRVAAKRFPQAKTYYDFRKMLDEMDKQIDAVVVSTPDHTHAPASVMAMKMGKHCYCEKPLTHSVYESRVMAEVAARNKLITQMGTQHHATSSHHRIVELIWSGAIGPVGECHVWTGGDRGGGERPTDTPPIPPHLKWDLWLGPAPYRPYHPDYVPYRWRFWWDFGTGETGNNGVHIMDLAFWALKLRHPTSAEAEGPPVHPETTPRWMTVHYEFPARGEMPPVKVMFYHVKDGPPVLAEVVPKDEVPEWESGVLFMGEKGRLLASYGKWKLLPESKFADFQPPERMIPDSIGHHKEWIVACKNGGPTTCNFDYSGALTEAVLLGNVAYRVGEKLQWDSVNVKAANCPRAEAYVRRRYREGWTL